MADVKYELLTDIKYVINDRKRNAATSNKYMKEHNKDLDSSYLMYLDSNNLFGLKLS